MPLDPTFWNDSLLCDYDKVIEKAENITIEDLKKNRKYSHRILSTYFQELENRDILIERLINEKNDLKEFLLIEEFTSGTYQDIVGEIMELSLSKSQLYDVTKTGQKKVEDYSKYDKFAGIIKLYQKDPKILIKILLLEKSNRRSQSKFVIKINDIEKMKERFDSQEQLEKALELFDKEEKDNRKSKFLGWFDIDGDIFLYFIREFKRSMALKIETTRFDTVCEWIIIRIPSELNQVRVSYQSNIDIKKFIPTIIDVMHKKKIKSEKERIKEFEVLNAKEDVKLFFETILKDNSYSLVEIRFDPAPFRGAPVLTLSDKKNKTLINTIRWFEENKKDLFKDISSIKECKIYFNGHRLKMKFNHKEKGVTIRYLDSTLFINLRKEFEKYMIEKFKLSVIPGV